MTAKSSKTDETPGRRPVSIVLLAAAMLVVIGVFAAVFFLRSRDAGRFNIVLITFDTTRADRLGCYGYPKSTSATTDALAADAARFTFAVAQAAVTNVSHASILTGLNPPRHGCRVFHGTTHNTLRPENTTLAEVLGENGYTTGAFISAFPVARYFGMDQGFETFDQEFQSSDGAGLVDQYGFVNTGLSQRRADATTDAAIRWLKKSDAPHFLWVHYFDPHDPVMRPPDRIVRMFPPKEHTTAGTLDATYDAEVYYMDQQLDRLFAAVKESGQWDRTVVVLTADHGEGLGDHNWWTHGILYQEQIHVPLIIRVPGKFKAARIDALVRSIDIMPTVLELAGIDQSLWPDMDGYSLVPLLRGEPDEPASFAYADSTNIIIYAPTLGMQDEKLDRLFCTMDRQWKLIVHQLKGENSELYNLADDPRERTNLIEQEPEQRKRLTALFDQVGARLKFVPTTQGTPPEVLKKLRTLGYTK